MGNRASSRNKNLTSKFKVEGLVSKDLFIRGSESQLRRDGALDSALLRKERVYAQATSLQLGVFARALFTRKTKPLLSAVEQLERAELPITRHESTIFQQFRFVRIKQF